MSLYGNQIHEKDMYPAIHNLVEEVYRGGYTLEQPYVSKPYTAMNDRPDIIYIRANKDAYVVEAKRRLFDIYDAIHQLRRYRGNFKYVALPDGEYFSWEGLVDKAIKRSFGLSTSLGNFTCFDISSLRGLVPLLNQSGGEYEKGF